jgi:hypothetical protein
VARRGMPGTLSALNKIYNRRQMVGLIDRLGVRC